MKKNWLDDSNWFEKVDAQGTQYKRLVFQTFQLIKSHDEPGFGIDLDFLFKDTDIASYILSHYYFQRKKLLENQVLLIQLKDVHKARYILLNGCMSNFWEYIVNLHPIFSEDKELVTASFSHGHEQNKLFPKLMKDRKFIDSLLAKDIVNEEMLDMYPQDLEITKALLKRGYRPEGKRKDLYSTKVFDDQEFIKSCLKESHGRYLYPTLPETLQNDLEICDIMLYSHPGTTVKNSSIKTIDDFIKQMYGDNPAAKEIATNISNMQKYPFIIENAHHIQKVFKAFKDLKSYSYIDDMGDPYFESHIFQDFLKETSANNVQIQKFLETAFGQQMMDEKVSARSYEAFQSKYIPLIPDELEKFLYILDCEEKLQSELIEKNSKLVINKI